jgi:hypothetical protein
LLGIEFQATPNEFISAGKAERTVHLLGIIDILQQLATVRRQVHAEIISAHLH